MVFISVEIQLDQRNKPFTVNKVFPQMDLKQKLTSQYTYLLISYLPSGMKMKMTTRSSFHCFSAPAKCPPQHKYLKATYISSFHVFEGSWKCHILKIESGYT